MSSANLIPRGHLQQGDLLDLLSQARTAHLYGTINLGDDVTLTFVDGRIVARPEAGESAKGIDRQRTANLLAGLAESYTGWYWIGPIVDTPGAHELPAYQAIALLRQAQGDRPPSTRSEDRTAADTSKPTRATPPIPPPSARLAPEASTSTADHPDDGSARAHTAPNDTAPEAPTSDDTAPNDTAPEAPTSDDTAPNDTAPDGNGSDTTTVPGSGASGDSVAATDGEPTEAPAADDAPGASTEAAEAEASPPGPATTADRAATGDAGDPATTTNATTADGDGDGDGDGDEIVARRSSTVEEMRRRRKDLRYRGEHSRRRDDRPVPGRSIETASAIERLLAADPDLDALDELEPFEPPTVIDPDETPTAAPATSEPTAQPERVDNTAPEATTPRRAAPNPPAAPQGDEGDDEGPADAKNPTRKTALRKLIRSLVN
ncbi:MAG: hypothetical protein AAF962_02000 [Actinomycetota bacterium]